MVVLLSVLEYKVPSIELCQTTQCKSQISNSFKLPCSLHTHTQDNTTAVDPDELLALQIVSYIGCIISLICLLATIIFFFVMG